MNDLLTAARALLAWQFLIIAIPCLLVIGWVLWAEARAQRIDREREAANARTRAHIAAVKREEQLARANAARTRREESPANQRTPAPWFDGGAA